MVQTGATSSLAGPSTDSQNNMDGVQYPPKYLLDLPIRGAIELNPNASSIPFKSCAESGYVSLGTIHGPACGYIGGSLQKLDKDSESSW